MIKYSIIIPTLNEEKLLPNLLETLSDSEFKKKYEYEIIISDGGSTDSTILVAEKYADKIIEINNDEKQNIAMGRNIGAQNASGEFFIFFNGDIYPKNLEKVFKKIEDKIINSDYAAISSFVKVFPDEEKFIDKIFSTFYSYYFWSLNIFGLGMGRGECHILSRKIFEEFGGYNENLAAGEDFDLYKRIRKKYKIYTARDLIVYESPRRYRKLGHFRILFTWLINSIYIIFTKKSKSNEWKPIR
ncbi:MAG: hypothetical protein CR986_05715 [Ignavibacteriae bacterium]|nr:MAG: hypothetical protein CR986_05715 [Ignavibacteriota bacterium]